MWENQSTCWVDTQKLETGHAWRQPTVGKIFVCYKLPHHELRFIQCIQYVSVCYPKVSNVYCVKAHILSITTNGPIRLWQSRVRMVPWLHNGVHANFTKLGSLPWILVTEWYNAFSRVETAFKQLFISLSSEDTIINCLHCSSILTSHEGNMCTSTLTIHMIGYMYSSIDAFHSTTAKNEPVIILWEVQ